MLSSFDRFKEMFINLVIIHIFVQNTHNQDVFVFLTPNIYFDEIDGKDLDPLFKFVFVPLL